MSRIMPLNLEGIKFRRTINEVRNGTDALNKWEGSLSGSDTIDDRIMGGNEHVVFHTLEYNNDTFVGGVLISQILVDSKQRIFGVEIGVVTGVQAQSASAIPKSGNHDEDGGNGNPWVL